MDAALIASAEQVYTWLGTLSFRLCSPLRPLQAGDHSRVWSLESSDGPMVLKAHALPHKFAAELRAYRDWQSRLAPAMPRLHAHDPVMRLLLLSHIGATQQPVGVAEEQALYRQAGAFLRRLHTCPCVDDDPLPPRLALARRWHQLCRRASRAGAVDAAERLSAHFTAALAALEDWPRGALALTRIPCHRDFQEQNWHWQRPHLRVFDFEHARLDLWPADIAKLAAEPQWAQVQAAFWEGYEHRPSQAEQDFIRAWVLAHGLSTWLWGRHHAAHPFSCQGAAILAAHLPALTL